MARIVRFRDLEATWTTKRAREPGFMRWLVTWVGGPAGHINTNPGTAVESSQCAVGLMYLPRGQRQAGKHVHGVAEIYIVLEGALEGFDASGHPHRAGPMDCTYIPADCPHGVRNCGLDDAVLVWVHDHIERNDAAVYYADDHDFGDVPMIDLVRFADLQADWSEPGARVPGTMRWSVNWVGGLAGAPDPNPDVAARNARVAIGMTMLEPGHAIPAAALPVTRLYLVVQGEAIANIGAGNTVLGRLDGLHLPAGEGAALRNNGPATLKVLWIDCPAHDAQ
jgi:mannose-6-phosphate isomerase-like protein (cupin superfamily)